MLRGIRPPGTSSAPVSGKIAMVRGRSAKPGSKPRRAGLSDEVPGSEGGVCSEESDATLDLNASGEHQRRELAAPGQGHRIGRTHRLEELQQLLARRLFVPGLVRLEDLQQLIDRRFALIGGELRDR